MTADIRYKGAETINYKKADFSELKYIKIIYKDKFDEVHEYKTETNFLSDDYISLYVKKITKKEENKNAKEEIQEQEDENLALDMTNNYLKKLAEIREIKEKAEATGNYGEYYTRIAELSAMQKAEEDKQKEDFSKEEITTEYQEENQENPPETKEEDEKEDNEEYKEFEIDCPQNVILKFVIGELLYVAEAELSEVAIKRPRVYFKIKAPEILKFEQHRRYYRIDLKRLCILIATNKKGSSSVFIARSINLSAGGILINRLEGLSGDGEYVSINPEEYVKYNLIIVLEMDKVLKIPAKYIRQEEGNISWKYGFEFSDITKDKTDIINKYVIGKQIDKLRSEFDMKNKNFHIKHKK